MGCLSENVLSAFLEGALSDGEERAVHEHLDACADCRAVVAEAISGSFDGDAPTIGGATIESRGPIETSLTTAETMPASEAAAAETALSGLPIVEGYRLLRRLGRGSMGEVYLAQDEQLDRPVAIKFLSAKSQPSARKRFLVEARAVARLRHPHIVTIYSSDITGERPYIVSELLSGQSLDHAPLPLPFAEVSKIAAALASGLAAAHRQGVLHRDIKPANVMRTDEGEIKLLDFGLAKLAGAPEAESSAAVGDNAAPEPIRRSMTRTGALVGTPLYMAPEVWRGEPATARSDVYSLGAMLYELSAGRPARRATTLEKLRKEVAGAGPPPLRQAAPAIDSAFAAVVDRCLSPDPADRFASAVELSAALDAIQVTGVRPRRARRTWLAAAGFVAALGIAAAAARGLPFSPAPGATVMSAKTPEPGSVTAEAARARRSVAVLPFSTGTDALDAAWLKTAFGEVLGACLGAGETLRIVPGAEVSRMLADLDLRGRTTLGEDDLRRIRQYGAVDLIATGSLERSGSDGRLRVRAAIRDAASGASLATAEAEGDEKAFQDVAVAVGERLLPGLGALPISEAQVAQVRAVVPPGTLAARLYAEGLDRYRAYDFEGARERLERAAVAAPDSPMPHHRLAVLWSSLGQQENERRATKLAFERASGLLREQRLQIEAHHHTAHFEKERALEKLRMLHELFPDSVEHGIELARQQPRAEGLATLARLRKLPPPAGDDPLIGIAEYQVGGVTSYRVQGAQRAAEAARARGARLLVGVARNLEGWGLKDQGQIADAETAWNDALAILEPRGHVVDASEAMRGLASLAMMRDDVDGALARYETAERLLRSCGNHASLIYALRNVAGTLAAMGSPEKGRPKLQEAMTIAERSGNRVRIAQTYYSFGVLEHRVGNIPAARAAFERSLAITAELKDARLELGFYPEIALLHMAAGELAEARSYLERTIAGRDADERVRRMMPDRRHLARLALEEGQIDEAARLVDAVMSEAEREGVPRDVANTSAVKARVLLAQGDLAGATAAADAALAQLGSSENLPVRIQVKLDWAHVHARSQDHAELSRVEQAVTDMLALARRSGFGALLMEARFAECEVAAAREPARARACFQALATDARAKGFLLVARKASEKTDSGAKAAPR